jgi:hypothetical protein
VFKCKVKVNFALEQAMKAQKGEQRYNSSSSLTSELDGGRWLNPRPDRFTPWEETHYQFYRRLGGSQGRSGRVRKFLPSPGFDSRTVQPVASRSHMRACYRSD